MMTPLPLGITLALSLTCGSMPLLAQGTYMPGPMPATSGTKQDPTDMYLEALRLVTQAAGLVEKRDYIGAIRLTQQAEDKFGRLAKSYPQWRPNLLQTRRQLNRENLDQWQKLAQQQAAASSSSGLELERPASVPKRPRPKPNIALPPGYKMCIRDRASAVSTATVSIFFINWANWASVRSMPSRTKDWR